MVTPAAKPSDWDEPGCGCVSPIVSGECWNCGRLALALWGHEWKLVAVLAYTFKVLLGRQAGKAILVSRFVDDGVDRCMCRCRCQCSQCKGERVVPALIFPKAIQEFLESWERDSWDDAAESAAERARGAGDPRRNSRPR